MRIKRKTKQFLFTLLLIAGMTSCGRHGMLSKMALHKLKPTHAYSAADSSYRPDYSDSSNWLVRKSLGKQVDIFFIHPTSYKKADYWNMPLDDTATTTRTYRRSIRRILSIFDGMGNVYAPKYRQATFYAFMDTKGNGEKAIELASADVQRAFAYYLKHINRGRPFILVAHSQGSRIAMDLLPDIFKNEQLKKQLIAAYVVGWPISLKYLQNHPEIESCNDSLQTSCIISWNTETRHAGSSIVDERSLCINPLNWSQEEVYVPATKNLGAVFYLNAQADTIPHYIGARCRKGILVVDKIPDKNYLKGRYAIGILHRFDYNFFYLNVQHNTRQRIEAYFQKQ
jgi:hypothetical protein